MSESDSYQESLKLHHELWTFYGDLLDNYQNKNFTSLEVSKLTFVPKRQINKLLHQLIHEGVVQIAQKVPTKPTVYRLVGLIE